MLPLLSIVRPSLSLSSLSSLSPPLSLSPQIRLRLENERLGAMLFNEEDVETMFTMFDPTRKGLLTRKQVKTK